jgi:SAM-dependent methyltransferase
MLLERIASLKPDRALDIGCGHGCFSVKLAPHCREMISVDISLPLLKDGQTKYPYSNISYLCMDTKNLGFPNGCFDTVLERAALHHMLNWHKALDEMCRVSSRYLFIEEPIDDPRSEAKRNTEIAQQLYLDIQKEVGYPHFKHIAPGELVEYFWGHNLSIETSIEKSDKPIGLDEFFGAFVYFVNKSKRPIYWEDRLAALKNEFAGKSFCESDILLISIDLLKQLTK